MRSYTDLIVGALSGIRLPLPEPCDLDEKTKLAIAVAAGCEIQLDHQADRLVMRTKHAIEIVKLDDRYRVYESPRR